MMQPTPEVRLELRERPQGRSAVMYQSWRDLLFVHWKVEPEEVQCNLPDGLTVDTFEGKAYLGVVPFFMCNIRPRFFPTVPGISNFLEMNVRTYVYDQSGRPGVWFYSLDANQWLAVRLARSLFHLPYFDASMSATKDDGVTYSVTRNHTQGSSKFLYTEIGESKLAEVGSLEFFLVERYLLFAQNARTGELYSGRVHHPPYPISSVKAEINEESCLEQAGFYNLQRHPDHTLFSSGVDVEIFALETLPLTEGAS